MKTQNDTSVPLFASKVAAGFPSPAEDYVVDTIDLNRYLIMNPAATFLVRAKGTSMINVGIYENDVLVVDRSLEPTPGKIVIAAVDGEFTVKRLHKTAEGKMVLLSENPAFKPIDITDANEVCIWGVVSSVIHSLL